MMSLRARFVFLAALCAFSWPAKALAQGQTCESRFNRKLKPSQLSDLDLEAMQDGDFTVVDGQDCFCHDCEKSSARRRCMEKDRAGDLVDKAIGLVCADRANRPPREKARLLADELSEKLKRGIASGPKEIRPTGADADRLDELWRKKYEKYKTSRARVALAARDYFIRRIRRLRAGDPDARYELLPWTMEERRILNVCGGFLISEDTLAQILRDEDKAAAAGIQPR